MSEERDFPPVTGFAKAHELMIDGKPAEEDEETKKMVRERREKFYRLEIEGEE